MAKQVVAKSHMQNITEYLLAKKESIASILPAHLTPERLVRIACAAVSRQPVLAQCTIPSLYLAVWQAAQLGLEVGINAHLVPFRNKKGVPEAIMVPDYRGLIDLALRSGTVEKVEARIVYSNDLFDYEYGTSPYIKHKPRFGLDKGDPIGVYAVAFYKGTGATQFVLLDAGEVEKVRQSSKAKDSGPWKEWPDEMWKKTAVKRLSKFLPRSIELRQAIQIDDAAERGETVKVGIKGEDDIFDFAEEPAGNGEPAEKKSRTDDLADKAAKKTKGKTEPKEEPPAEEPQGEEPPDDEEPTTENLYTIVVDGGETGPKMETLGFVYGNKIGFGKTWVKPKVTLNEVKVIVASKRFQELTAGAEINVLMLPELEPLDMELLSQPQG